MFKIMRVKKSIYFLIAIIVSLILVPSREVIGSGQLIWKASIMDDLPRSPSTVSMSADGSLVAMGSSNLNYLIRTWNGTDGVIQYSYQPSFSIFSSSMSYDGEYTVYSGMDDVLLFNRNHTLLWKFSNNQSTTAYDNIEISSDGEYIIFKNQLLSCSSNKPIINYSVDHINHVAISNDGNYVVLGQDWSTFYGIHLCSFTNSTPIWTFNDAQNMNAVDITANGEYVIAAFFNRIYYFHRSNSTPIWVSSELDQQGYHIEYAAISKNGESIIAAVKDRFYIFSPNSATPNFNEELNSRIYSVAISDDGYFFAVGTGDGSFHYYKKGESTPIWSYNVGRAVVDIAISENGKIVAIISGGTYNLHYFRITYERLGIRGYDLVFVIHIIGLTISTMMFFKVRSYKKKRKYELKN